MLVRKYCSAIGPRITPMTSGGMGRLWRRMKKPITPNSFVSQTSVMSLRSAKAPMKQNTTISVFRMGAGTRIKVWPRACSRPRWLCRCSGGRALSEILFLGGSACLDPQGSSG
jgi:hypothetical protein